MEVTVERRPGSIVQLTVTVDPTRVQEQRDRVMRHYAQRVKVPGFRPGHAPMRMVEERIDPKNVMKDVIDDIVEQTYGEVLTEQNLQPLEQGKIEDLHLNEDASVTYKISVCVRPEITLTDYTGLEINHTPTTVTEDLVDAEMERLRERTAEYGDVEDAGIEEHDYVTVDYTMMVDGQPYPEGDATGYPLEIGSDTFFPELNAGLLGVKVGSTVTVEKEYPDDYAGKELAGKSATFQVTVTQVRRRMKPELDDAWAQAVTGNSAATLEEVREHMRNRIEGMAKRSDRDQIHGELVRRIVENAELDLPSPLVEEEYEHLLRELQQQLARERMDLALYAEVANRTVAEIEEEYMILARDIVRRSLVLGEIGRRETIEVTDDDLTHALVMEALNQGAQTDAEIRRKLVEMRREFEQNGQLEKLRGRLFHQKVLTFLETNAKVITTDAPVITETEPVPAIEMPKKARKPRKSAEAAKE